MPISREAAMPDRAQRAQLIVLANLQIGLHEQTRLQPQILEAMNSAVTGVESGFGLRRRSEIGSRESCLRGITAHDHAFT